MDSLGGTDSLGRKWKLAGLFFSVWFDFHKFHQLKFELLNHAIKLFNLRQDYIAHSLSILSYYCPDDWHTIVKLVFAPDNNPIRSLEISNFQ